MNAVPVVSKSLLKEVAYGNETAFKTLFQTWQPLLARYIFSITKSKEDTEEIIQDVFLKIWQGREVLDSIKNFRSYLLVVAKNHALNIILKKSRLEHHKKLFAARKFNENSMEVDLYLLLDAAIDQLSHRQKQVYILSRQQRKSHLEIARQLGIGTESVKTHISLAKKHITRMLKESQHEW